MKNWENKEMDIRTNAITYTIKRRDTLRMAMTKVLQQNKIDMFVNPVNLTLQGKIGGAQACAAAPLALAAGFGYGAMLGIPEVFVPAGFADSIYDSRVRARRGRQELRGQGKRDAHEARRHRLAVQHRASGQSRARKRCC